MNIALALRLARRELRSGLSGFRIFFASLVLGVMAIAAVGSLSEAFLAGLSQQGRVLLGGDVSVGLVHRQTTAAEHAFLARYGRVSETVSMRAMAYAVGAQDDRQLVELKAGDDLYPLYGRVRLSPDIALRDALRCDGNVCGAVAEETLFDRLHIARGGIVRIGTQLFRIDAVLAGEPDRISGGFSLGPHILISGAALKRTGLVTLGSLIEYSYRIAAPPSFPTEEFRQAAARSFPDAGWEIRTRENPAPGTRSFIDQVAMFLALAGLTVLAVGGVGAGQAISAFLDRKRAEIAIFKSLGADGALIFAAFFIQIMAIAALAVVAGAILGALVPFLVEWLYGAELPIPADFALYPQPLLLAAAFGLLAAAAFAIPPLARARAITPASLFRDMVDRSRARIRLPYLLVSGIAGILVLLLALAIAPSRLFAADFLGGIAIGLLILRLVAGGLRWAIARLPRVADTNFRLALANLVRPGAGTAGVVTALGLGLTLLVTVVLLGHTIGAQVRDELPESAPSFFFIDIQPDQVAEFDRVVSRFSSARDYRRTPMIRGRIISLKGVPARDAKVASDSRWALNGDRGITYAAALPKDTEIVEGKWWPAAYRGPTLISFDAALAHGMGLKIGDVVGLNVLGREIDGRIANLRDVNFASGRQNFVLILSPGLIDKAPHSFLATVRVAPKDEEPLYRAVTDAFPSVSAVRVKEAIAQVGAMLQQLSVGIEAAGLVTILAGLLVLAGAIAAGQQARLSAATILKVLGASRGRIFAIYAIEYGLLGAVSGVLAAGIGTAAAWAIAGNVFGLPFAFEAGAVALTVLGGGAATLVMGLAGSWRALTARPARQLREQ
ncbi:MAG TPA: FtsX-like permease family protein [Rhizomicrobium sp.]|jgi:putative ABC transport system permease protein|nr:FtsX-like permease family protein [Rhizomicrobium sp.]